MITRLISSKVENKYNKNYILRCMCYDFFTAGIEVKGSYPLPPEANATPVSRSLSSRSSPMYGGKNSLTPNLEAV